MAYQYEIWLSRWPIIYVMIGFCVFGILCKLIAGISCMRLAVQVKRLAQGKSVDKHSMTRELIAGYREYLRNGVEVQDMDNYIEEAVAGERLLGIHVYQLENMNLTMMVTCFTLGVIGSLVAFLNGARDDEIVFIFTVGLALTGIMVIAEVLFRNDYYRMLYLLGMQNYLTNVVRVEEAEEAEQQAELEQARQERKEVLWENENKEARETPVNRQAKLLEEIANARRQSSQTVKGETQESTEAGIAAAKEAFSNKVQKREEEVPSGSGKNEKEPGKTAIDNDLLEDILRSLLMDN